MEHKIYGHPVSFWGVGEPQTFYCSYSRVGRKLHTTTVGELEKMGHLTIDWGEQNAIVFVDPRFVAQ